MPLALRSVYIFSTIALASASFAAPSRLTLPSDSSGASFQ